MKRPLLQGRRALVVLSAWIAINLVAVPALLVFFLGEIPVQFGTSSETPSEGSVYSMTEQDLSRFPWIKQMIDWFETIKKYCAFACDHCSCPYQQPPLRGIIQRDTIADALQLQKFEHTSNGQDYYFDYFAYNGSYFSLRLGSPDLPGYLFYGTLAAGAGSAAIGVIWSKRLSFHFIRK